MHHSALVYPQMTEAALGRLSSSPKTKKNAWVSACSQIICTVGDEREICRGTKRTRFRCHRTLWLKLPKSSVELAMWTIYLASLLSSRSACAAGVCASLKAEILRPCLGLRAKFLPYVDECRSVNWLASRDHDTGTDF